MQLTAQPWGGTTALQPYLLAETEPASQGIAARHLIRPERIDVSHEAHNSFGDLAAWENIAPFAINAHSVNCDPLPALNQSFRHGFKALILTALTATLPGTTWLQFHSQPATAEQWDNPATFLLSHPTMQSPQVHELQRALPHADVMAIRDLYDLTDKFFGDVPDLEREYSFHRDHDTGEPVLFLTVRTHGKLDVDQLLDREKAYFSEADAQPALKAAQAYHVVTAV